MGIMPSTNPISLDDHMADPDAPEPIPDFTIAEEWPCDNTEYAGSMSSEIEEWSIFIDSEADLQTLRDMEVWFEEFPLEQGQTRMSVDEPPPAEIDPMAFDFDGTPRIGGYIVHSHDYGFGDVQNSKRERLSQHSAQSSLTLEEKQNTPRSRPQYEKWPEEESKIKKASARDRAGPNLGLLSVPSKALAIDLECEAMVAGDFKHSFIEKHPLSPHPQGMMRYPTVRQIIEESLDEDGKERKPTQMQPDPKQVA